MLVHVLFGLVVYGLCPFEFGELFLTSPAKSINGPSGWRPVACSMLGISLLFLLDCGGVTVAVGLSFWPKSIKSVVVSPGEGVSALCGCPDGGIIFQSLYFCPGIIGYMAIICSACFSGVGASLDPSVSTHAHGYVNIPTGLLTCEH